LFGFVTAGLILMADTTSGRG